MNITQPLCDASRRQTVLCCLRNPPVRMLNNRCTWRWWKRHIPSFLLVTIKNRKQVINQLPQVLLFFCLKLQLADLNVLYLSCPESSASCIYCFFCLRWITFHFGPLQTSLRSSGPYLEYHPVLELCPGKCLSPYFKDDVGIFFTNKPKNVTKHCSAEKSQIYNWISPSFPIGATVSDKLAQGTGYGLCFPIRGSTRYLPPRWPSDLWCIL